MLGRMPDIPIDADTMAWLKKIADRDFDGDIGKAAAAQLRAGRLVAEAREDLAAEGESRYRRRRGLPGTTT